MTKVSQFTGAINARVRQVELYTAALAGAIVVGLLLRLHCLIFPYLWLDEYVTVWSIGGSTYAEMLDRAVRWTANGPLFVLCYRFSSDCLGLEWGLKLPSVVAGTLCIVATSWSAMQLFGQRGVSLAAAWLVALAPQFIHFSQESRPYMVAALAITLAMGLTAAWLRDGRHWQLAAALGTSVVAVGFHLLCALFLAAMGAALLSLGVWRRWSWDRWVPWCIGQLAAASLLWFGGMQFRLLGERHGSMVVQTELPMHTRSALDLELVGAVQLELAFIFALGVIFLVAWRFRDSVFARACDQSGSGVVLAALAYCVPAALLSLLCAFRMLDCWPRYYFLFLPGFMLALAWVVTAIFPVRLSLGLIAAIIVGMMSEWNCVGGVLSCRLNGEWMFLSQAPSELRRLIEPDDLVLTRSGLIEANHERFRSDPIGRSYLNCFWEAKDGPLPAQHVPLPFSPESEEARRYLDDLFATHVAERDEFWLVNMGPADFDYNDWIGEQYGDQFERADQLNYPALFISRYVRSAGFATRTEN